MTQSEVQSTIDRVTAAWLAGLGVTETGVDLDLLRARCEEAAEAYPGSYTRARALATIRVVDEVERLRSVASEAMDLLRQVWERGDAEGRLAELWNLAGRIDQAIDPTSTPVFIPQGDA